MSEAQDVLLEQLAYYRARAPEYDDWWFRRGRYDDGPEAGAAWAERVAALEARVEAFALTGDVLELACGTGLWTRRLVAHARRVTAVDGSPEVLALNRARLGKHGGLPSLPRAEAGGPRERGAAVEYVQVDLFTWNPPPAAYDVCFFGFWLSHVPPERFAAFWALVRAALRPGGRAVFVDSGPAALGRARGAATDRTVRSVADGREFRIVKRIYDPAALTAELAELGFTAHVETTPGGAFILGEATPGSTAP